MAENAPSDNKGTESKPEYLNKLVFNLPVEVEITGGLFRGNYLTRILKIIKQKDIFLEMPLQDGKVFKFWPHTVVHINFYFDNEPGAVYTFTGRISKTGKENRKEIFVIPFPKEITRIQRRSYVRVDCRIPINFKIFLSGNDLDGEQVLTKQVNRGFALDLSGGGVFLRTPIKLDKGQDILTKFSLRDKEFEIKSKIMRVIEIKRGRKKYYKYGVLFIDIEESYRRNVISYVFDIERKNIQKLRRKGL